MLEFITIEKTHPKFQETLLGGRDPKVIPIPIKSLHVNRKNEEITFQMSQVESIRKPGFTYILFHLFRIDLLALTFSPAIVTLFFWVMTQKNETLPILNVSLSFLILLILHAAIFSRNDFIDHMGGVDRMNEKSGRQIIQRGWLRARSVRLIYWSLFFAATLLALPVLLTTPELFWIAGAVALLGSLGYSKLRLGQTHWLFGMITIWSCLGLFISIGITWVLNREVTFEVLLFGSFFGLLAVTYVEMKNMISVMMDHEARLFTMPVSLGFDKAKLAILFLIFLIGAHFALLTSLRYPDERSLLGLPVIGILAFLAIKIYGLKSPLSSQLLVLPKSLLQFYLISGLFFLTILIW